MGKVMQTILLENFGDVEDVHRGLLPPDRVRSVEVEALVDTGATTLVIPPEAAEALGVREVARERVRYADGRLAEVTRVRGVQLTLVGRTMLLDALVQPGRTTALIGQIPLEQLDLIVDPKSREVRVNPESP